MARPPRSPSRDARLAHMGETAAAAAPPLTETQRERLLLLLEGRVVRRTPVKATPRRQAA